MSTAEQSTQAPIPVNLQELRDDSIEVSGESVFSPDDPLSIRLKELGIRGQPVAEISAGQQVFTVLNLNNIKELGEKYYKPFTGRTNLSSNSPTLYELDDDCPLVLVHFNSKGNLVGRAIRPDSTIYIGRTADERDLKSSRFEYQDDKTLSRDHFSLTLSATSKQLAINDRGSTNGTRVRCGIEPLSTIESHSIVQRQQNQGKLVQEISQTDELGITETIINIPELHPEQRIEVDDQVFYLSPVVRNGHDQAILFSNVRINGVNKTVPRLLYKSRSDGGWRVAYGTEPSGRFIKEAHASQSHYVQETKLHPKIIDALEKASAGFDELLDRKIQTVFSTGNPEFDVAFTAPQEVTYPHDPNVDEAMKPFRTLMPGELDNTSGIDGNVNQSLSDYFQSLDSQFNKMVGFVPDFTAKPSSVTRREHTLLGNVVIESFPAEIGGRAIVWEMASDMHGRIWVDNIRYADVRVTSYGNYNNIFNAGLITNKPVEYSSQVRNLTEDKEKRRFSGRYDDISPLIANLLPIRKYKLAKQSS